MTLKKWMKSLETCGVPCNIYIEEDGMAADPIYCGSMYDIPYWMADLHLGKIDDEGNYPIFFAHNIRKTINDEHGTEGYNGFVITLTEEKNE